MRCGSYNYESPVESYYSWILLQSVMEQIEKGFLKKYLGIYLTEQNDTLFKDNYKPIKPKIQSDLRRWSKWSWLGRLSSIKWINYQTYFFCFKLFQFQFLKNSERLAETIKQTHMEWQKSRIRFKILQDEKKRGGLKVSNSRLYYTAAGLLWISDWIKTQMKDW